MYMDPEPQYRRAAFAAGCFWDAEAAFRRLDGIIETVTGYTGGSVPRPAYEQVDTGTTGHVQAVGIVYDPAVIPYDQLLDLFWEIHDPTQAGGQGDYKETSTGRSSSGMMKSSGTPPLHPAAGLQPQHGFAGARS